MKKFFSLLVVVSISATILADTLYLKAESVNYAADNAVVAIWSWGGSSADAWAVFQSSETTGVSYVTLPSGRTGGKIMRWPAGTTPDWSAENNAWNKTGDIAFPATYPASTDMLELTAWDGATSGTWSKYNPTSEPVYYLKNNWDGGDWTWKEMTKDGATYKLENVVFGGGGVNVNTSMSDSGAEWVQLSDFKGATVNELDTVTLVYNPSEGSITATLLHACVRMDVKLVPTIWKTADEPKFAAWVWIKSMSGRFTSFFTPIKTGNDTLHASVIGAMDSIIFVRFADTTSYPRWDSENDNVVWNEVEKTKIDKKGLTYTITGWGEGENAKSTGTWESYIPVVPVKYYITGDSALVVDAGLEANKAWNSDAIKSEQDTFVFKNLKVNQEYQLKVVDGENWKGHSNLTIKADGLYADSDDNVCFKLNTSSEVKVIYTSEKFQLTGDFYVKPVEKKIVKLIPSEEWLVENAKFAAWVWGEKLNGEWTDFFTPLSAGNDTLKATIKATADSIDFVRFSPKAKTPTWDPVDGYSVVWGELKDTIDWNSLTASIVGWDILTWKPVARACESFGLTINGTYHAAKKNVLQTEWLEYKLLDVELKAGDKLQVRDDCNNANWVIPTFAATSFEFNIEDGKYVIAESGTYDFYLKFIPGNDEIYISKHGHYTQSVPTQCEDVLMQAFYNESYNGYAPGVNDSWGIGDTRWYTLTGQADEIGYYFDLVWLPPSSKGSGMGYHPKQYNDQSSNWGSGDQLYQLITALHERETKVVADVVINHCEGWTSWCDFPELNFGDYGIFHPDASYICKNDEVNAEKNKGSDKAGDCYGKATGPFDDGENWDGARDWAHDAVYVQDMFKAYLKWLHNVMGYDGFRYDKGDGFNNWHHDNYNKAAGPYIAFMECYSNTDEIWRRIGDANYNLMGLDFDTKWHVFDAIAGWDYNGKYDNARGDGLMGRNKGRYAVTFIDSHDWFLRSDNDNEFGGSRNSLTEALKPRLLQANAFLLCMPGVPCVFYPHWAKYKQFIKPMIEARKAARVHSESEVKDEYATATGYQATIVGKEGGYIILCLGDKAHQSGFDGYELKTSYYAENDCDSGHDASFQIWVKKAYNPATSVESTQTPTVKAQKYIQNGKLYIQMGDRVYDILGQTIK